MISGDRKITALKTLLLTLLLAVQVLGHAHVVDHMAEAGDEFCYICSVTGHGDCAAVDSGETVDESTFVQIVPSYKGRTLPRLGTRIPETRAPPIS